MNYGGLYCLSDYEYAVWSSAHGYNADENCHHDGSGDCLYRNHDSDQVIDFGGHPADGKVYHDYQTVVGHGCGFVDVLFHLFEPSYRSMWHSTRPPWQRSADQSCQLQH